MTDKIESFKLSAKVVEHIASIRREITRQDDLMAQYVQGAADGAGLEGAWTLNEAAGTLTKVK